MYSFVLPERRLSDVLKRKRTAKRPATSTSSRKRQDDLRSSLMMQEMFSRGKQTVEYDGLASR